MGCESSEEQFWIRFVEIHTRAKQVFLLAEELDPEQSKTWMPPLTEYRHALEHIVRAKAAACGVKSDTEPRYIETNLDKALGHVYRAFFDAADWLAICLREAIPKEIEGYSNEAIQAVLPAYYSKIRPTLLKASVEIAGIREGKDIGQGASAKVDKHYIEILMELVQYYKDVRQARPALDEFRKRERKKNLWAFLIALGVTCLGVVLGFLLARVSTQSTPRSVPPINGRSQ